MIIDTNVYSALDAGQPVASEAIKGAKQLCLPVIVIAELKYGFKNGRNCQLNENNLDKFLSQPTVQILYATDQTAEIYAELATFSRRLGRSVGSNDLWIAALAKQHEERLITYDRDFEVFKDILRPGVAILK